MDFAGVIGVGEGIGVEEDQVGEFAGLGAPSAETRIFQTQFRLAAACYTRCQRRATVARGQGVIVKDPEILGGMAVFRGTRVPFKNLVDYLEGGHSLDEFLRQFPTVTREMAIQALEEAKDSLLARIA